ncbi:MAG: TolC family protein [Limisphaerales bacterium]
MKNSLFVIALLVGGLRVMGATGPWTLEDALALAVTNSPDARIAAQRVVAARAGVDQANAAVWPTLQFQSSYTRTDNPMMVFGSLLNQRSFGEPPLGPIDFNHVPDIDNLNAKGVLMMPLYAGGQIRSARQGARAGAEASRAEAEAVRQALAFEVARTFHSALKTREFIRAGEAAVQAYENNLGIARKRQQAGALLKSDVLDVEVRLAQAREELVRARNARSLTERALRNLLGLEDPEFTIDETVPQVVAPSMSAEPFRPELDAMGHRERAAEAAVRGARSGWLPRLSAFGSLDYDYGTRTDGGGSSYTAGALLQWNLWDGQLTRARVAEARADLEGLAEQQRKVRLAVGLEVEQAHLSLAEADERLAVTAKATEQAAESVELTRSRFEQGLALSTQLFDAETALTGARVRRAEAEADRRIAVAALRRALGLPQLDTLNPAP